MITKLKFGLIFCLIVVASLAYGAGGQDQDQSSEPVELLWYGIGGKPADTDQVFQAVNEYLDSQNKSFHVKYDAFDWGDFTQKLTLVITSGEPADIVFMASWAGNFYNNASNNYLTKLDDVLDEVPTLKNSLPQKFWDAVRVGGSIYSVPTYKDMVFQQYVAFKKGVVDELGLDIGSVKTFKDLTPLLKAVHDKDPKRVAYDSQQLNMRADFPFGDALPIALSFDDPEKGFQVVTDIKAFRDAAMLSRSWYEAGYIAQDAIVVKDGRPKGFTNWFARVYQGFPGAEGGMKDLWGDDIIIQEIDAPTILTNNTPMGSMLSIPNSSPHKKEALEFIAMLNTDPRLRNLVGYGIEGVHYSQISDMIIERTDQGKENYNMPNFSLGSLLPLFLLKGDPPDGRELLKAFNENAEPSPALGFTIDADEFRQELATVKAFSEPYRESLLFGVVPVDETLDEWRGKLKDAGWYEVVDTINKRYMEWKANQ